jgi:hypothetical protein
MRIVGPSSKFKCERTGRGRNGENETGESPAEPRWEIRWSFNQNRYDIIYDKYHLDNNLYYYLDYYLYNI